MTVQPETKTLAQWQGLHCQHIGSDGVWPETLIHAQLQAFPHWQYRTSTQAGRTSGVLLRQCQLVDFAAVEPVIQSLMTLARTQDHHPDVRFGYNTVSVEFSTHSAGGISNNDWICAALFEAVLQPYTV